MTRHRRPVALLVVVVLGLAGCTERETVHDEVRSFIAATQTQPRRYTYVDASLDRTISVEGVVEDDFRYTADLSIDDSVAYREVVDDDAIIARMLDPRTLEILSDDPPAASSPVIQGLAPVPGATEAGTEPAALPAAPAAPEPSAAQVRAERLLRSGRWVEDPVGAPPLLASTAAESADDPVFDALRVFRHVERAMDEAADVYLFNPDAPEYIVEDDPFPQPDSDAGVTRYDLEPPPLPRRQDLGTTGAQQMPDARNFRKMAIYVRDGIVVRVLEKIDVAAYFDDLEARFDITPPEGVPVLEQVRAVSEAINQLRVRQGEEPLRVRSMSFELSDVGGEVVITRPRRTVRASLSLLDGRGRGGAPDEPAAAPDAVPTPQVAPPATPAQTEGAPAAG